MNGTYKRSRNYRTLALSILGGIGLAAFALPALASNGVSVNVSPTTGYSVTSSTISTPRGTTVGPSGGVPSVTVRPAGVGGGLSQSMPAGIEITGIRQNSQTLRGPLGTAINVTSNGMKNAARACMRAPVRCNLLTLGAGAGLQALLDGIDGLINDSGVSAVPTNILADEVPKGDLCAGYPSGECVTRGASASGDVSGSCPGSRTPEDGSFVTWWPDDSPPGRCRFREYPKVYLRTNFSHLNGRTAVYLDSAPPFSLPRRNLTPSEIDSLADSFEPTPSDWSPLIGGVDLSSPETTIEITSAPSLTGANEPNFIEWSDGTSQGTYSEYTPTITNNNSHKPEISIREETHTTDYDAQGNPTGTTTETSTIGGSASPQLDIPTDCEFMPTVCRFIDWFTEPDPSPDPDGEIRDLVQVYEDGGRTVELGPSMGSCPPPRAIALSFVPAVEVSFQPFCDLAAAVRFWLLAIAYFGAAYLTVRSI